MKSCYKIHFTIASVIFDETPDLVLHGGVLEASRLHERVCLYPARVVKLHVLRTILIELLTVHPDLHKVLQYWLRQMRHHFELIRTHKQHWKLILLG